MHISLHSNTLLYWRVFECVLLGDTMATCLVVMASFWIIGMSVIAFAITKVAGDTDDDEVTPIIHNDE